MQLSRRTFLQLSGGVAIELPWSQLRFFAVNPERAALCRKLASDALRPQYHLLPAHNWMTDPNGPIFFR